MRELSDNFLVDLKNAKGVLHPILKRTQNDHTLMLAIRDVTSIFTIEVEIFLISKNDAKVFTLLPLMPNMINLEIPCQL